MMARPVQAPRRWRVLFRRREDGASCSGAGKMARPVQAPVEFLFFRCRRKVIICSNFSRQFATNISTIVVKLTSIIYLSLYLKVCLQQNSLQ
jgi:hypothetical protein